MWSELKEAVSCMLTQDDTKTLLKEATLHSMQLPIDINGHVSLHFSGKLKCQSPLSSKGATSLRCSNHVNSVHITVAGTESIVSFKCLQNLGPPACARRLRLAYVTQKVINSRTATDEHLQKTCTPPTIGTGGSSLASSSASKTGTYTPSEKKFRHKLK